jgi:hypothetical protein
LKQQVSKLINFEHFSFSKEQIRDERLSREFSIKVCCYYCEKEIQQAPGGVTATAPAGSSGSSIGSLKSTSGISSAKAAAKNAPAVAAGSGTFYPDSINTGTGTGAGAGGGKGGPTMLNTLLWCQDCKDWAQRCVVCETAVRGTVSVCAKCGHGGHFVHMQRWFARSSVCASGCGCTCTTDSSLGAAGLRGRRQGSGGVGDSSDGDSEDNDSDDSDDSRGGSGGIAGAGAGVGVGGSATKRERERDRDRELGGGAGKEEYAEDGEKLQVHDIYNSFFGITQPDYLEEIYNQSSDYNYNNFQWGDAATGGSRFYDIP